MQLLLLAVATPVMCEQSHADGKFFRAAATQFTNSPAMPSQAAVIGHHDGIETLIVESGVASTGEPMAWLIPVPAVPTSIAPASRGTVMTAMELVGPQAFPREDVERSVRTLAAFFGVAVVVGLILRVAVARSSRWLVVLLALLVLIGLFLPSLGRAGGAGGSTTQVNVLRSVEAGAYDVHVIDATDAQTCAHWLTQRGFVVEPAALPVLQAAIDRGWVFCAAEVRLASGTAAPHPLAIVFPSPEIVYPMALTATTIAQQGTPLTLDLVVFADHPVEHPWMTTWAIETVAASRTGSDEFWFAGPRGLIRHPGLASIADQSQFATRLHGTIDGTTQQGDMTLRAGSREPFRAMLAGDADIRVALFRSLLLCSIALAIFVLPFWGNTLKSRSGRLFPRYAAALIVTIGVVAIVAELIGFTVVDLPRSSGPSWRSLIVLRSGVANRLEAGESVEAMRELFRERLVWTAEDGSEVSLEGLDVPFGWTVTQDGVGKPVVTVHDATGLPLIASLDASGRADWRPQTPSDRVPSP